MIQLQPDFHSRRPRRGHTLVEVVIALGIVVISVLPSSLLFLASYRVAQQARAQAIAHGIAQQQIARIRMLAWTTRIASDQPIVVPASANTQVFGTQTTRRFTGTYTVTARSSTVQQISVKVNWPSLAARNKTSEIALDTLVAKAVLP